MKMSNGDWELPELGRDESIALCLRAMFERAGYRRYVMDSFEEYDLYLQNRSFLAESDIITFTGEGGRVMALRPDMTLSIVKNTRPGDCRRVYYSGGAFRRSRRTGEFRSINQIGLEFIGGEGREAEAEVLKLALQSLETVGDGALDLSHMGVIDAVAALFGDARDEAVGALGSKSPHMMLDAAKRASVPEEISVRLASLCCLSGPVEEALQKARGLLRGIEGAERPLRELEQLWSGIGTDGRAVRLDFSIVNDADYYNGLIFQGYVRGMAHPVLAGGRYDNLMARFGNRQGAVGFALYLDEIGRENGTPQDAGNAKLRIALPKGRMGEGVYRLFQRAGLGCGDIFGEGRRLMFEDAARGVLYYLVKPSDVGSYVEHGAADIGVVGKDTLLECGADVLELLDLKLGACRLVVAGAADFSEDPAATLRVATKYPAIARRYYAGMSRAVEIIRLNGSIELAPLTGLADVIVDIVESGSTLRENNLSVIAEIAPSSARLIANRSAWRFKGDRIRALLGGMEELL